MGGVKLLVCHLVLLVLVLGAAETETLQTYIVQLHPHEGDSEATVFASKHHWHVSFLEKSVSRDEQETHPASRLLYSYHTVFDGFAAQLTDSEAAALRSLPGVASVRADRRVELHTTYSPTFLGLNLCPTGAWARSGYGHGTIIGVLDTGVWPESPSFDDRDMPPVPTRWTGACESGERFDPGRSCNRKLIGARFYAKGHRANYPTNPSESSSLTEYVSPRDAHGHGTHTASTAAGSAVPGASVLGVGGLGEGEAARGVAPGAHVAAYKVCWFNGCYSSDILAGMDDAVRDGVDVLSLSLGGFPIPLFEDSIAIGSFRATERGVSVVCAAGNSGPAPGSVANEAPWVITVGAATMDRRFPAYVRLGDGRVLYGESMYHPATTATTPGLKKEKGGNKEEQELEIVYGVGGTRGAEYCLKGSLDAAAVKGKMVICDRGITGRADKGDAVKKAGGAAMILANSEINGQDDSVDVHVLPATLIGYREAVELKKYIASTRKPTARIVFGGTRIGRARAPTVALFSARGPSVTNPSILKPDVVAPGVNIIAAWPGNLGPSGLDDDARRSNFSVLSGTSMACPHVSGVAALVRAAHPSWSPAMVRSAIMTSAEITDRRGKAVLDGNGGRAGVFAMGAGHVSPARAVDPGLVYDVQPADYVTHLCTLGYTRREVFKITHAAAVDCGALLRKNRGFSLNYPSIAVAFKKKKKKNFATSAVLQRTVTNVGAPNSTYTVQVAAPPGVKVSVEPTKLTFLDFGEKRSFRVTVDAPWPASKDSAEGYLVWKQSGGQGKHVVRSPIAVTWMAE